MYSHLHRNSDGRRKETHDYQLASVRNLPHESSHEGVSNDNEYARLSHSHLHNCNTEFQAPQVK
jgi:hypothetical protein